MIITIFIPAGDEGNFPYNQFNCLAALGVQQDSQLKELDTALLLQDREMKAASTGDSGWDFLPTVTRSNEPLPSSADEVDKSATGATAAEIDPPEELQSNETEGAAGGGGDTTDRAESVVVVRRRSKFHRSVSIGSPRGKEWSPPPPSAAAIGSIGGTLRKRNSSHEEQYHQHRGGGGTAEFLAHTSPAWKRLFDSPTPGDASIAAKLVESPIINFLLQWNDLESVRLAMQFSLRKAVCRVYAMHTFNWLLRSVSQPVCLHDLLWCLISALQQQPLRKQQQQQQQQAACGNCVAAAEPPAKKDDGPVPAAASAARDEDNLSVVKERDYGFEHPMSDLCLVGGAVRTLPSTFHTLLQTISGQFTWGFLQIL